ncbi:hypothetical protein [Pedosphaera parvula]|uniref:Uncharacterized protein n=1 Tax=Pedosphaera parvula (strain Ellin514) TaxID=320771 RepID=B9XLM9_PEDPL|nr:hypothetical protein [Pedosphaera parvula]EEF59277.1 hypothetical protein Cflav_PD2128 [Pedosphaera parvula Ellin514]
MQISIELKEQVRTVWLAIRFLIFGLLGFWFATACSSAFLSTVYDSPVSESGALIFMPIFICLGALMMLFGFNAWRRWDCFWVFLSLHVSFLYAIWAYERTESDKAKMLGSMLIVAAGVLLAWIKSRSHHQQQASQQPPDKNEVLRRRIRLGVSVALAGIIFFLALPHRPDISGIKVVGSLSPAAVREIMGNYEISQNFQMRRKILADLHQREIKKAFSDWRKVRYTRVDRIIDNPDGTVTLMSAISIPGEPLVFLPPTLMSGWTCPLVQHPEKYQFNSQIKFLRPEPPLTSAPDQSIYPNQAVLPRSINPTTSPDLFP